MKAPKTNICRKSAIIMFCILVVCSINSSGILNNPAKITTLNTAPNAETSEEEISFFSLAFTIPLIVKKEK